jgi:hypothetical protein
MGASPNPLMSGILPLLMAKMAAGGGMPGGGPTPGGGAPGMPPGGPGTGPSGSPADMAASAGFGRELSSARQADPAALAMKIHAIKMQVGEVLSATLASNPGVARALGKTLQGLDAAIKEATQAATTLQVAQPIQSSAATGAPGAGGASPGPVGVPGMGQQ